MITPRERFYKVNLSDIFAIWMKKLATQTGISNLVPTQLTLHYESFFITITRQASLPDCYLGIFQCHEFQCPGGA